MLETIRANPKTVKAAVVRGSTGHLIAKLLLELNHIPQDNLNLVTYSSGAQARMAVAGGVVDLIIISAQGSLSIRDYLRPLAIVSDQVSSDWPSPIIGDALSPLGIDFPTLSGSMRGFATSKVFKRSYPERFRILTEALRKVLLRNDVQDELMHKGMEGRWLGPRPSSLKMESSFEFFRDYAK